ncbi:transcription factor-like 5 protein [Myripristis murdjan]|uniref:transcription factor-like 5 protein n=1 Tax=Myripristis murdjan TaxID=586833 RepID=UPI001175FBF1|nr:transcription factor-like 5 protein [Myripristis murdjan]
MSAFSTACKGISVSPSSREYSCDSLGVMVGQSGCMALDQGQILSTELSLAEMTEIEYTHLQHVVQTHMEAQAADPDGSDARFHISEDASGSIVVSLSPTTQAIDLSTSTEEQSLMSGLPGEKTPTTFGEVPASVLARAQSEVGVTQAEPPANSSNSSSSRPYSTARVCLEKRFNCMPGDIPRPQDAQSAVLSNFLTVLQQSTEAQDAAILTPMQKWMRADRAKPIELSKPYGGGMFNPIAGICGQVFGHIPHIVEPSKSQGLLFPKNFPLSYCPERVITKAQYVSHTSPAEEQRLVKVENNAVARPDAPIKRIRSIKAAKAVRDPAGEAGSSTRRRAAPCIDSSQRRERHNIKERERRRRIRLCCDELNLLVPFCRPETDKATTLQWATAFLKYIQEVYGDTFKEEFQNALCNKTEFSPKMASASGQVAVQQEMGQTPSTPLAAEQ